MRQSVGIVGAGVSGLVAARGLAEAGHQVRVLDRGRSVGGRLATRRIGEARLDHGAQFFTIRTDEFASTIGGPLSDGTAYEWCRGFGTEDGHPRYAVRDGMNRLAKYLATDLDVTVDVEVESVASTPSGWELRYLGGSVTADALVLTAPIPQSLRLLTVGRTTIDPQLRARLDAVTYHPTLAVLATLDRPPAVPAPGGVQLSDGPFGFVADNQAKGISEAPAVTLHATHELSRQRWDDDPDTVLGDLLTEAQPWLGDAVVVEAHLKRWRYAQPADPAAEEIATTVVDGRPLVFAGDAFAGARVEGAFRSGAAAARHLASVLAGDDPAGPMPR